MELSVIFFIQLVAFYVNPFLTRVTLDWMVIVCNSFIANSAWIFYITSTVSMFIMVNNHMRGGEGVTTKQNKKCAKAPTTAAKYTAVTQDQNGEEMWKINVKLKYRMSKVNGNLKNMYKWP